MKQDTYHGTYRGWGLEPLSGDRWACGPLVLVVGVTGEPVTFCSWEFYGGPDACLRYIDEQLAKG